MLLYGEKHALPLSFQWIERNIRGLLPLMHGDRKFTFTYVNIIYTNLYETLTHIVFVKITIFHISK